MAQDHAITLVVIPTDGPRRPAWSCAIYGYKFALMVRVPRLSQLAQAILRQHSVTWPPLCVIVGFLIILVLSLDPLTFFSADA